MDEWGHTCQALALFFIVLREISNCSISIYIYILQNLPVHINEARVKSRFKPRMSGVCGIYECEIYTEIYGRAQHQTNLDFNVIK